MSHRARNVSPKIVAILSLMLIICVGCSNTSTTAQPTPKPGPPVNIAEKGYAPICPGQTPCAQSGTAPDYHSGGGHAQPSGAIVIGDTQVPDSVNPMFATQNVDYTLMNAINGACAVAGADLKWLPDECVSVPTLQNKGVSADGKTVTMKLQSGLQWSDGQPLTADDFVWGWQALTDPKTAAVNVGGYSVISQVTAADAHTVVVQFNAALGPYLSYLPYALPKHLYEQVDHSLLQTSPDLNFKPAASSGPYMVSDYQLGSSWTLTPNPHYTSTTFYGPFLSSITLKVFPNVASETQAFAAGQVSLAQNFGPGDFDTLRQTAGAQAQIVSGIGFEQVTYNQANALLTDVNIRQALTQVIDKCAIVQGALKLTCPDFVANALAGPHALDYQSNFPAVTLDVAKANQVLDKAGFTKRNSDGIRLTADGKPLSFRLATVSGDTARVAEANLLIAQWKAIGVQVSLTTYRSSIFFADFTSQGVLATGQWDIALFAFKGGSDPDYLFSIFHSSGIPSQTNPGGSNYAHISNPQIDQALQGERNLVDFAARLGPLGDAEKLIVTQQFAVAPLYSWPVACAVSGSINGIALSPALHALDWNIADWWLAS